MVGFFKVHNNLAYNTLLVLLSFNSFISFPSTNNPPTTSQPLNNSQYDEYLVDEDFMSESEVEALGSGSGATMGSFVKPFSLDYRNTFYRNSSGYILNTGVNANGQLGHSSYGTNYGASFGYSGFTYATTSSTVTTTAPGTSNVLYNPKDYSSGYSHSAIVTSGGAVYTTGYADYGQLGNGTSSTDDQCYYGTTTITTGAVAVSCGQSSTFVLKSDGSVWATGIAARIGQSSNQSSFVEIVTADTASARGGVVDIAAGYGVSYILYGDGSLYQSSSSGWTLYASNIKLIDMDSYGGVVFMVDNYRNIYRGTTLVLASGSVNGDPEQIRGYSTTNWGYLNSAGELYLLDSTYANSTIDTVFKTGVAYFDMGDQHYAYLTTSGQFYLWGGNNRGQVASDSRTSPSSVATGLSVPSLPTPAYLYGINNTPPTKQKFPL